MELYHNKLRMSIKKANARAAFKGNATKNNSHFWHLTNKNIPDAILRRGYLCLEADSLGLALCKRYVAYFIVAELKIKLTVSVRFKLNLFKLSVSYVSGNDRTVL